jgi:catechol 2,3-dioxygenase-like lactoylglutathione lyase family enzyme
VSEVIDHVGIRVSDLPVSRGMYEAALAELGFLVLSEGEFEGDAYVLFGRADSDDFCLHTIGRKPGRDRVTTGAHIAFCASDAGSVIRWHDAAVGHGGIDIGPPGLRPSTAATTTPHSFSILTGTMSRPSSTRRRSSLPSSGRFTVMRRCLGACAVTPRLRGSLEG